MGDEHAERSQFALDLCVAADDAAQRGLLGELFARSELFYLNPYAQFNYDLTSELGDALGA